jgi:hypothetical protein
VRKLGRLPSRAEYSEHGIHHAGTLHARIVWSQMSHKFVLLVREFHLEREWEDVVKIVVGKFPLLEQQATSNWQKPFTAKDAEDAKEEERKTYHGDTETRRTAEFLPLIATDNTDRQRSGMKLGKVVAAALAIEILMAAQRSTQQSAVSIQPEESNWQLANSNWPEQNQNQDQNQNLEPQRAQTDTEEMHALVEEHGAVAGPTPCGRPVIYGEPLGLAAMAHAPTNELGVLFLFGIMAAELGFRVERLQAAFPDCEAKREVAPGKWELVFIELEIYSRNFKSHRHNPRGCHAIVCWKHNWPDCPEWLEVIELSKLVKRLGDREIG